MNKKRILLLEDDVTLRRLLTAYLEDQGHQVTGTDEAHEALKILDRHPFDLIVTDGALKSSCGEEFSVQVRQRNLGIPVVLITGSIRDVNRSLFAGVLRKPFLRVDFLHFINDALGTQPTPDVSHGQKAA